MAGRIVLFGATGYTGDITARAMVGRGLRPLLAGRNPERLRALAEELGELDIAVADAARPDTVRALVERGDVLVTTVGPFTLRGRPALESAVQAGAHYFDCAGEPKFIKDVFSVYGPQAEAAGCALITSFGYDWAPGGLAGALALAEAGDEADSVDIGYFTDGDRPSLSPGTRATLFGLPLEPAWVWRNGRIVPLRSTADRRTFSLPSREAEAISVGAAEHFTLPRLSPGLRNISVYVGWMGPLSRATQALFLAASVTVSIPGMKELLEPFGEFIADTDGDGPGPEVRARTRATVVAEVKDKDGRVRSTIRLEGVNPYDLSAGLLSWGAEVAAGGGLLRSGALGPVDAFGLDGFEQGLAEAGMHRT